MVALPPGLTYYLWGGGGYAPRDGILRAVPANQLTLPPLNEVAQAAALSGAESADLGEVRSACTRALHLGSVEVGLERLLQLLLQVQINRVPYLH